MGRAALNFNFRADNLSSAPKTMSAQAPITVSVIVLLVAFLVIHAAAFVAPYYLSKPSEATKHLTFDTYCGFTRAKFQKVGRDPDLRSFARGTCALPLAS